METLPKYFRLDRRWIGVADNIKSVLDGITGASIVTDHAWVAVGCLALRISLSHIVKSSVASNALLDPATKTLTPPAA